MSPAEIELLKTQVRKLGDEDFADFLRSVIDRANNQHGIPILATAVVECCNGSGRSFSENLTQALINTHPTIRQCFVRAVYGALTRWVKVFKDGNWNPDARDEASFKFVEDISDKYHFPLI